MSDSFTFLSGGAIGGYSHANERFWEVVDGKLNFLNDKRVITAQLQGQLQRGTLTLVGPHLARPDIVLYLDQPRPIDRPHATRTALAEEVRKFGWQIGDHSYGKPNFLEKRLAKLIVGKYCSIAIGVLISFGNHRLDIASSYPFATLKRHWPNVPADAADHVTRGDVTIGNDVWIGTGAFISSGVSIGDGAVVGAHSIVTKDIPPYAVVAGSPARVIRHRFGEETVRRLLEVRWWDLADEQVNDLLPVMYSGDIDAFINAAMQKRLA